MPGDSAPAWLGSHPCLVYEVALQTLWFHASDMAALTSKERRRFGMRVLRERERRREEAAQSSGPIGGLPSSTAENALLPYKDKIYFFLRCLSWCGVTAYFPFCAQSWARTLGLAWLCCRRVSVSRSDSCFAVPPPYKTFGLFKKFCLFC